ncbi:hypothetical protein [Xanthomonas arboricola]|nr:hypothetical protein [Xanthomonas arboricola]MBB3759246.1 hypothetical protein [Xanthomonas arboricola]MBB4604167.1 hypothetical protein [Xanthomonas arboricola]
MTRRVRIAWCLLALAACYIVPHRLLELAQAHAEHAEAIARGR